MCGARNTPWSRNKKWNKRKDKKENRACQYNGAEMRKGEANDISWTIVLWAATVAAIISRLTLLFPWRRYGRAYKSTQTPEGRGGGRARRGEREGCRPYGAYTQTTHTLTWNTTTTTRGRRGRRRRRRGSMVCSRCSTRRGCMLGIRRRGHYKELWGPASYVQHPCLPLPRPCPPTILPFIVSSRFSPSSPLRSSQRILIHEICAGS